MMINKIRVALLTAVAIATCNMSAQAAPAKNKTAKTAVTTQTDREYWASEAYRMAHLLLLALSRGELHASMPIEEVGMEREGFKAGNRAPYAHLEAVGRLLMGIAPWLELPADDTPEGKMRAELLDLALKGIANGVDSTSPDYLNFRGYGQPLVDAAFLAQAFLRSPQNLWGRLPEGVQRRVIEEMIATRATRPSYNNWLLFSATVEAFLRSVGQKCDLMRTDYAFRQTEAWYVGDGQYSDGDKFHNDYYNSFVMQPMLIDAGRIMNKYHKSEVPYSNERLATIEKRATRYAEVLERSISPEGTFPVVGRSTLYRTGCMQSLAQAALLKILPKSVSEGQVRAALTAVMRRMLDAPGTYDQQGWLRMGFTGSGADQRNAGEYYLCTGSMYLASAIFLPLGLPANDPFWTSPAEQWTTQRAWNGGAFAADHAIGF